MLGVEGLLQTLEDNASPAAGYFASVNHGKERKKNMKKRRIGTYKRLLALVLALTMCFSMLQIYAYANQEEGLPLEPDSTAPAQPEPIDPPAPETFVGQEGQAGRDSWIDAGSAQDQAQDLLDQANTDAELETSTGEPGIGSVNVPNENGDYDHTETTTTTTDTWNGQAGSEETGKVEVEGSETTVKTESTVPAGQDNPPQVVGDKTVVDGEETISYEKTEETIGDESSEKLSPEELKEYIEGTDDKTVTVTAPTDGKGSSGQAVIGKVDEEKLVADQKTEKETAAKNELADKDKEAVDKLTADGFQPVYKVDETGNQVLDDEGSPIVEKYVKTDSITGEGEEGQKTTQVVRESSVETKPVEGDENSFETITKIVTTTTESTTAYKAPDDQPLKDIPEEQLTTVVDSEGKEIGKSASSQDPDTLAITVTTVYPEVDEEGNAYYRAVYVTTSADGLTVTTRTEIVKGETATVETTKTVTETKTETTAVQVVEDERTVSVTMTGVDDSDTWVDPITGKTYKHGEVEADQDIRPDHSKWNQSDTDLSPLKEDSVIKKNNNYRDDIEITSEYQFQYKGENGLGSAIRVDDKDDSYKNTWHAHQFVIYDKNGKPYFVYCADFDTAPVQDHKYNMENVESADYYQNNNGDNKAAEHIRYIATQGYWGTASGVGSLEAFKQTLKEAIDAGKIKDLDKKTIDSLTDGEALTATQAAIWYYGNSNGENKVNQNDIVGQYRGPGLTTDVNYTNNKVQKIFDYLITSSMAPDDSNTKLEKEHITSSSIKVTDKTGDTYNTEVSFSMTAIPSSFADDQIMVYIYQDGVDKPVASKRLSLADSGKEDACTISGTKGNYTVSLGSLGLKSNQSLTVRIVGKQDLADGAYLFSSENKDGVTSQTFVGIAHATHTINLKFGIAFEVVEEPEVKVDNSIAEKTVTESTTTRQWHAERENSYAEVNYPRYVPTPTPTPSEAPTPTPSEEPTPTPSEEPTPEPTDEPIDDPDVPLGTPEPDESIDDPDVPLGTPEPDEPIDDPDIPLGTPTPQPNEPDEELPDPDVPKAPAEPEEELPDPEVPLANVPKTGDSPVLWYVLTLVSGCGLLVLALSGKRRKAAKR